LFMASIWLALFMLAGVLLGHHRPTLARRLARICPLVLLVTLGCLLATGAHPIGERSSPAHRWLGHAMVILGWTGAWFSLGVAVSRDRFTSAIGKCTVVFAAFALVLFASFTGYLVPWDELETRSVGESTLNRFVILHMVAVPTAIALSLLGWWYVFRSTPSIRCAVDSPSLTAVAAGERE
jgi:hypothetical protein